MKIIIKHYGKVLKESLLEEGREYIIGRRKDCDFPLEEESGLSRDHIKIYQSSETGNWVAESLSELGGLYLEGEEAEAVELAESCELSLKNYSLQFIKEEAPSGEEESSSPPLEAESESPAPSSEQKEDTNLSGRTKLFSGPDLLYTLHVYIDGEISDHISLDEGGEWVLGRSEECDISIDYSILTRKHLKISKRDERFYVEDLDSANKTFLNGEELPPRKARPLKANDEISISDLKIIFEVRNRNFDKMMSNLPVLADEGADAEQALSSIAPPKVVLEDIPLEANPKPPFFNKKRAVIFAALAFFLAFMVYSEYIDKKEQSQQSADQQKAKDLENKLDVFYKDAIKNQEKGRYQFCINLIEELHQSSPAGFYKDSRQILMQCQTALSSQKQKEEYLAQEEIKKKTEEKIKKIAEDCRKKYENKELQTEAALDMCAAELLGGLDPVNPEISALRAAIQEKENLKLMEIQKKEELQSVIQSKKALYRRAKRIQDQNKPLEAIRAYDVFLRSARGYRALRSLSAKAAKARDAIQNKYDSELDALYESCGNLISDKKMKEAYYDCLKVLDFKPDDKKAAAAVKIAEKTIRDELKPLYEQSILDESFSRIEKAKELWRDILKRDIEGGYYYKKAARQIKKYQ